MPETPVYVPIPTPDETIDELREGIRYLFTCIATAARSIGVREAASIASVLAHAALWTTCAVACDKHHAAFFVDVAALLGFSAVVIFAVDYSRRRDVWLSAAATHVSLALTAPLQVFMLLLEFAMEADPVFTPACNGHGDKAFLAAVLITATLVIAWPMFVCCQMSGNLAILVEAFSPPASLGYFGVSTILACNLTYWNYPLFFGSANAAAVFDVYAVTTLGTAAFVGTAFSAATRSWYSAKGMVVVYLSVAIPPTCVIGIVNWLFGIADAGMLPIQTACIAYVIFTLSQIPAMLFGCGAIFGWGAIDTSINHRCQLCGNHAEYRCKRCHSTYYCSDKCNAEDWPKHRLSCVARGPTSTRPADAV